MTIIESVKNFMSTCPYFEGMAKIKVDFLDDTNKAISVEEIPTETILTRYLDGSTERQFVFVIAARLKYNDEVRRNINNSGIFENVQSWLESCTEEGNLPTLDTGLTPLRIEAMSNGYLFGIDGDLSNARYQIQCRLIYDKE